MSLISTRLSTNRFLSDLIGLGPDSTSNLFKVDFTPVAGSTLIKDEELNVISGRATTFVSPQRDSISTSIPYQNINIEIPTPNTNIPRTLNFTVRLDAGLKALSTLRKLQLIDNNGKYERDPNKKIESMTVVAYKPGDVGFLNPIYMWKFLDIYIISVTQLSYTYDSSNFLTCNVTLIWDTYTEGIPDEIE